MITACSLQGNRISRGVQQMIDKALEFNRLLASLAGTQTVLVLLSGDTYTVQWPATPAAVAAADLIEMGQEQHPSILGPEGGSWQLEDPQDEEGARTLASVRAADLAAAIQSETWALDTPLMVVFDAADDDVGEAGHTANAGDAPAAVSFSVAISTPLPPCSPGGL